MDTQELMIGLQVYTISLDNMWNFMFTVALAAVGFLATLRQVFDVEDRERRGYWGTVRTVQIGLAVFLSYGFFNMQALYSRLNQVLLALQEDARLGGEPEGLLNAFRPYALDPDLLREGCGALNDTQCFLQSQSPSLYGFGVASLFILMILPWIAGAHRRS